MLKVFNEETSGSPCFRKASHFKHQAQIMYYLFEKVNTVLIYILVNNYKWRLWLVKHLGSLGGMWSLTVVLGEEGQGLLSALHLSYR